MTTGMGASQSVEPGTAPPPSYAPGEEIVAARDRWSKTFALDEPGMRRRVLYSEPVHYRAAAGEEDWRPIDVALTEDGPDRYRNTANSFELSVARNHEVAELVTLRLDDDHGVSFSLQGARPGQGAVDPSRPGTIVYRSIVPHVDARVTSLAQGLKEELVLHSAEAPAVYRFPLQLRGLTAEVADDGAAVLYRDGSGEVRLSTPSGWMAEPDDTRGGEPEVSTGVRYRLDGDAGAQVLVMELDRAWLDDPARVFPVTVDPTYVYHYNHEPYFYGDVFYREGDTSHYPSYTYLRTGSTSSANYRAFMQFGSGKVTKGDGIHYISNATLRTWVYSYINCDRYVYAKRVTDSWVHRMGDFDATYGRFGPAYDANSGSSISGKCSGEFAFDLTTMARQWEDGTYPNYGIAFLASSTWTDTYRALYSKEHSETYRPHFEVDFRNTTPYTATMTYPANGAILPSSPTYLDGSTSDPDNDWVRIFYELYREGSSTVLASGHGQYNSCCGSRWTGVPALSDGKYYYRGYSQDTVGDYGSVSTNSYFTVDTTAPSTPSVSSSTHPNTSAWYSNRSVSASWSASDGLSGVTAYAVAFDQSSTTTPSSTTTSTSGTYTASSDGIWYLHVRARDAAGNWGATAHYRVQVDTVAPGTVSVSSSTHPQGQWVRSDDPAFSMSASDDRSGVAGYSYVLGTYSTAPVDGSIETSGSVASYSDIGSGERWFRALAVDRAGNAGAVTTYRILSDVTAPAAPASASSSSHTVGVPSQQGEITATWEAGSDAHSGVSGYSWAFTTSATDGADAIRDGDANARSATSGPSVDGTYYFHVRTIDAVGNASANTTVGPFVIAGSGVTLPEPSLPVGSAAESNELGFEGFFPTWSKPGGGPLTAAVNLRTGNLLVQHQDVAIPGHGLSTVLNYTYNHRDPTDTGMGAGWRLSVGDGDTGTESGGVGLDAISVEDIVSSGLDGIDRIIGRALNFTDGDGTTHRFVRSSLEADGRWASPPGVDLRLRETADEAGVTVRYELIRPDGVTYTIEQTHGEWHVVSITNRAGDRISLSYGRPETVGPVRLMSVTHNRDGSNYLTGSPASRITLAWTLEGALQTVTTLPGVTRADHTGAAVSYERTTRFARSADGLLETITELDGTGEARTSRFAYDTLRRMVSATNPRGYANRFAYGLTNSRAELVARGVSSTTFTKLVDGAPDSSDDPASLVEVADADGAATQYRMSDRGTVSTDDARIAGGNVTEVRELAADNNGDYVSGTFTWAANRLGAVTDGEAATTSYVYDNLGGITSITTPPTNDPARTDLPAGADTATVTHTQTYRYGGWLGYADCGDEASLPTDAHDDCYAFSELTRVDAAANKTGATRSSTFSYQTDGRLKSTTVVGDSATTADDRTVTLTYHGNGAGPLASIDGPRTDVTDITRYGDTTKSDFGYDPTGSPRTITDAAGKSSSHVYSPYGPVLVTVDRAQHTWRTAHDGYDRPTDATDPQGNTTTTGYDANGNVNLTRTPRGFQTTIQHDARDLPLTRSEPGATGNGQVDLHWDYRTDGALRSITDRLGQTTIYTLYRNGSIQTITAPAKDGEHAVTDLVYDRAGRVTRQTLPATNDPGHRPVAETDYTPAGTVAQTRQTSVSGAVDRTITYAYDPFGAAIETTGPRDIGGVIQRTQTGYDRFGQTVRSARLAQPDKWLVHTSTFDAAGNLKTTTRPYGVGSSLTTSYTFDALNRLTVRTDDTDTDHLIRFTYDALGRQTRRVDEANGSPIRSVVTDYEPRGTLYSLNAIDHTTGKTTASCVTTGAVGSGYDDDGNPLVLRTLTGTGEQLCDDASPTVERDLRFSYDPRGFVTQATQRIRSPQTGADVLRTQTFTHHNTGTWATATHDANTTTYGLAPAGWVDTLTDWRGSAHSSSSLDYHPSGATAAVVLGHAPGEPLSGSAANLDLARHPDGSIKDWIWRRAIGPVREHIGVTYDNRGLRATESVAIVKADGSRYPTSGTHTAEFTHDLADRLVAYKSPFDYESLGQPLVELTLDDAGSITREQTSVDGTIRRTLDRTYTAGRNTGATENVTSPTSSTTTTAFAFNDLGDETSRTVDSTIVGGDATRTATAGPGGHVTNVTITDEAGAVRKVDYLYDPLTEQVIHRRANDAGVAYTRLYFTWSASRHLAEETDGAGAALARWMVLPDGTALAEQTFKRTPSRDRDTTDTTGRWSWLLRDLDGNVATQLADDGTVLATEGFNPYGMGASAGTSVKGDADGDGQPDDPSDPFPPTSLLGYQGGHTDELTGNLLLGPRQYDPSTARFTTADTYSAVGLDLALSLDPLTANRYIYAAGNPITYSDDGHFYQHRHENGSWTVVGGGVVKYPPAVVASIDPFGGVPSLRLPPADRPTHWGDVTDEVGRGAKDSLFGLGVVADLTQGARRISSELSDQLREGSSAAARWLPRVGRWTRSAATTGFRVASRVVPGAAFGVDALYHRFAMGRGWGESLTRAGLTTGGAGFGASVGGAGCAMLGAATLGPGLGSCLLFVPGGGILGGIGGDFVGDRIFGTD